MPHSTPANDSDDELKLIQQAVNPDPRNDISAFLNPDRELVLGEKADDAIDYEDVDLDDLPDEEPATGEGEPELIGAEGNGVEEGGFDDLHDVVQEGQATAANGAADSGLDFDDLFGEVPSSPAAAADDNRGDLAGDGQHQDPLLALNGDQRPDASAKTASLPPATQKDVSDTPATTTVEEDLDGELYARQMALFGELRIPPPAPETREEALAAMFPKYRKDQTPRFMELLPPKRLHYQGKAPLKIPKAVQPTKIALELSQDQERDFKTTATSNPRKRKAMPNGFVQITEESSDSDSSDDEIEYGEGLEGEVLGGATWTDLEAVCQDWNIDLLEQSSDDGLSMEDEPARGDDLFDDEDAEWDREFALPPPKRVTLDRPIKDLLSTPVYSIPSFDDPEHATAKIAQKVVLDLNDPHLLVDYDVQTSTQKSLAGLGATNRSSGSLSKDMARRYNISNDEAYEQLKENLQSKVRSTLGSLKMQHSLPALRLQYPYYKVRLAVGEARSFHRPTVTFHPHQQIRFSKLRNVKKKHTKQKETRELFHSTRDLSLADNASMLLLEYSEEHPYMLSNFGMGSRLVNHYRRKDMHDPARPKLDIGETDVLLPQDKSPFKDFGFVKPGEVVPTLYNEMYQAPVFKHRPKPTDFLVIRNSTGVEGPSYHLRNIENLHVVGQQLPLVEVPGPGSRKVTTAAKSRMQMIAFRKLRKDRHHRVSTHEVTEHFPGTEDPQTKTKLKEFLRYNKDVKEWEVKPGETVPDSAKLRSLVRPEDLCLLESSQVGARHLQDAGYGQDEDAMEDADGADGGGGGGGKAGKATKEANENQSLDHQTAPWFATRNFLAANQGKAMLELTGKGDPTGGRREAFSFVKVSMKGGFRAEGESAADKMNAKQAKEAGGHGYNVAAQRRKYDETIAEIWNRQMSSLSSTVDHSEMAAADGLDDDVGVAPEDLFDDGVVATPRSEAQTPAHRGDDEQSLFSKMSTASQKGRILRITRQKKVRGGRVEKTTEVIKDPKVIKAYLKERHAMEAQRKKLSDLGPTGNTEEDRRDIERIQQEVDRLKRNRDRRLARDKAKGIIHPSNVDGEGTPDGDGDGGGDSPAASGRRAVGGGTQRKCANCGQVGHIKTNKKLCPMLNGTAPAPEDTADGFGSVGTPATMGGSSF